MYVAASVCDGYITLCQDGFVDLGVSSHRMPFSACAMTTLSVEACVSSVALGVSFSQEAPIVEDCQRELRRFRRSDTMSINTACATRPLANYS